LIWLGKLGHGVDGKDCIYERRGGRRLLNFIPLISQTNIGRGVFCLDQRLEEKGRGEDFGSAFLMGKYPMEETGEGG
jgi:hypothetical protein